MATAVGRWDGTGDDPDRTDESETNEDEYVEEDGRRDGRTDGREEEEEEAGGEGGREEGRAVGERSGRKEEWSWSEASDGQTE